MSFLEPFLRTVYTSLSPRKDWGMGWKIFLREGTVEKQGCKSLSASSLYTLSLYTQESSLREVEVGCANTCSPLIRSCLNFLDQDS